MKKDDSVRVDSFTGEELLSTFTGKVQWVIENEVSIHCDDDIKAYTIIDLNDPTYKITVTQEAAPSFQSQVANLTDEELHAQIESLRNGRVALAPEPKKRATKVSKEDDELMKMLALLSPEEQANLTKKLGL